MGEPIDIQYDREKMMAAIAIIEPRIVSLENDTTVHKHDSMISLLVEQARNHLETAKELIKYIDDGKSKDDPYHCAEAEVIETIHKFTESKYNEFDMIERWKNLDL